MSLDASRSVWNPSSSRDGVAENRCLLAGSSSPYPATSLKRRCVLVSDDQPHHPALNDVIGFDTSFASHVRILLRGPERLSSRYHRNPAVATLSTHFTHVSIGMCICRALAGQTVSAFQIRCFDSKGSVT